MYLAGLGHLRDSGPLMSHSACPSIDDDAVEGTARKQSTLLRLQPELFVLYKVIFEPGRA